MEIARKRFRKIATIASVFAFLNATASLNAEEFVTSQDRVPLAAPGVIVTDGAPEGWSHLVLKSCPRANTGDIQGLSNTDRTLSSMFRTVTLANVVERVVDGERRYQLDRIALGLCVPVKGKGDMLVTPGTQKKLGANLGFLGRTVLSKIFSEFERVHFVCRSDTVAIFDSPVVMHYSGKNQDMIIRYAHIVNQDNGRLDALAWLLRLDADGKAIGLAEGKAGAVQWLPENHVIKCSLHVDANEYTFGIPSKRAFGVAAIPHGKVSFAMPKHLRQVSALDKMQESDAEELVSSMRKVVAYYDKKSAAKR